MRMHEVTWTRTVLQTTRTYVFAEDARDAARLSRKPEEQEWQGSGVSRRPHISEVREYGRRAQREEA